VEEWMGVRKQSSSQAHRLTGDRAECYIFCAWRWARVERPRGSRPAHGARRTAHGARRTAHGARRTAHGARRTAHGAPPPRPKADGGWRMAARVVSGTAWRRRRRAGPGAGRGGRRLGAGGAAWRGRCRRIGPIAGRQHQRSDGCRGGGGKPPAKGMNVHVGLLKWLEVDGRNAYWPGKACARAWHGDCRHATGLPNVSPP
jgi:hypothetical protein